MPSGTIDERDGGAVSVAAAKEASMEAALGFIRSGLQRTRAALNSTLVENTFFCPPDQRWQEFVRTSWLTTWQ